MTQAPSLRLPHGQTLHTDRVRAAPAVSPSLSLQIGVTACVLGVLGLCFPRAVSRAVGSRTPIPLVRLLFGARELASGIGLTNDPTKASVLWARVAGDAVDIAALKAMDNPQNPKRGGARAALAFVLLVTVLDVVTAARMSRVQRNCPEGSK